MSGFCALNNKCSGLSCVGTQDDFFEVLRINKSKLFMRNSGSKKREVLCEYKSPAIQMK